MGLLKVKQRQLIALRQVSEKPQITHQVTDGLADLGAVARKSSLERNGPSLAASTTPSAAFSPSPSMLLRDGISLPSMIWNRSALALVNIDRHKVIAPGIHFLYDTHIAQGILLFLGQGI